MPTTIVVGTATAITLLLFQGRGAGKWGKEEPHTHTPPNKQAGII